MASAHFKAAMEWMSDVVASRPQIIKTAIPQNYWSEMVVSGQPQIIDTEIPQNDRSEVGEVSPG